MRRPSTHPDRVASDLERVRDDLPGITKEYHQAWLYGFDRRDRKGNHLDQTEGDHARGKAPERQAKVTVKGLPGNPTLTIMAEQEWVRRETKAISNLIGDLVDLVKTIDGRLGRIFHDPEEEYEPMRRQPILGDKEKTLQKRGEAYQRKRELQEEEKRLVQQLIRVRREMKESA